jgi:putative DNA primase/helicase
VIEYDFDPLDPPPREWLSSLDQICGTDSKSIAAIVDWFGSSLTHDAKQPKILMMDGPKHSGRGTISRVLKAWPTQVRWSTMDELPSPIAAFHRDRRLVELDATCPVAAMYESWRS